jgi:hypothetical protein
MLSIRFVVALVTLIGALTITPTAGAAIGAGCGESGPTRSDAAPFALIRPHALAVNGRIRLDSFAASQTAGATVRLDDIDDGTMLAETPAGEYACVAPASSSQRMGVALNGAGNRSVTARGTLTLVNGNGVTRRVYFVTTIVDATLLPARAPTPCRYQVASPVTVLRGDTLGIAVRACRVRTLRVGLVALDGAHRGNIALRRTFTPEHAGVLPTAITIGALQTGTYRLVLLSGHARLARAAKLVVVHRKPDKTE